MGRPPTKRVSGAVDRNIPSAVTGSDICWRRRAGAEAIDNDDRLAATWRRSDVVVVVGDLLGA